VNSQLLLTVQQLFPDLLRKQTIFHMSAGLPKNFSIAIFVPNVNEGSGLV
jgi:hypothetical protein